MEKPLTPRQERYVSFVLSGLTETEAARRAGYGAAYSKVAGSRIGIIPVVKMAIEKGQAQLREKALYEVEQAVAEVDKAIAFGYERTNPMSVAKLLELKCKLYGLLIERVETVTLDLKSALADAERRVVNATALPLLNPSEETRQALQSNPVSQRVD